MVYRLASPNIQYVSSTGEPLAGGKLNFYLSGTDTRENTYQNSALTIPNSNPVILDTNGYAGNIFLAQSVQYKVVLTDANDVEQWTIDPVSDPTATGQTVNSFLAISGASLTNRSLLLQTSGVNRWSLTADATTEAGANAGSNFALRAYDDAGNLLSTPLSINRSTGVVTLNELPALPQQTQTQTAYTTGSGTYTTPTGCVRLHIRMNGGGGGGGGSGTSGQGNGGSGSGTSFGSFTAAAGNGGVANSGVAGGVGGGRSGTGSGTAFIRVSGGAGSDGLYNNSSVAMWQGGSGGSSPFGGAGAFNRDNDSQRINAASNSGSGGAGATSTSTSFGSGGGGGAGEYVEFFITSPTATYSYSVDAGGSGGVAGTSGATGGAGGSGCIYIEEYYI